MATYNETCSLPSQQVPLNPISVVDIFFPGLTNISAAFQQLQTGNTNGYVRILCICGLVVFLGKYAYKFVDEFVENHFTSTVHVSHSNEAYDMLVTWVSRQPFAHKAASSLASVGGRRGVFTNGHADGSPKKALQYLPWNGSFLFWYKNHLFTFRSTQTENRFFPREEISVSCIGRSSKALKDLFSECRTMYLDIVKNKTSIFEHHNGDWKKTKAVDIRQLDTVILNNERKTALLDDVKSFLDSQAWYSARGIPYRRGYLLYGPPGTGKSSLSLSIAGQCDLDIYILSLSSVDDDSLGELFTELPARCVILLEDIDAVNTTHSRQRRTVSTKDATSPLKEKSRGKVSLSALLNAIDGVGSQEGRILFMTTNHVDRLDAALIRPGRVDLKLELGLTNQDINTRLFLAIFRRDVPGNKGKVEEETALKQLAADFAGKVPQHEFSPAEIQSFLLGYRESPHTAVQSVEEWIVRAREEKMHMTRAVSLVSEGFRSDIDSTLPDRPTASSAITQDSVQAADMASAIATVETPIITTESHCCSCQVLEDIKRIYQGEERPSVEQSLFLHYLSEEACRRAHADLAHSTLGLLNLLLDFVKKVYTSSAECHSTQPAAPPGSPNLPSAIADNEFLPLAQPKLNHMAKHLSAAAGESKNGKSMAQDHENEKEHGSGRNAAVSDLPEFWDEKGWEHIVFDSKDAADLWHDLPSLGKTYSNAELSKMTPDDDASSGTSFELGSEISCEIESIVGQDEVTEESPGLESNCQLYQQPATPPASPITSTLTILNCDQEKKTFRHIETLRIPSTAPCRHCCSCQPRSKVSALAQDQAMQDVSTSPNTTQNEDQADQYLFVVRGQRKR